MPLVLALNPGSNSFKFDLVDVHPQKIASKGKKLLTGTIDGACLEEGMQLAHECAKIA